MRAECAETRTRSFSGTRRRRSGWSVALAATALLLSGTISGCYTPPGPPPTPEERQRSNAAAMMLMMGHYGMMNSVQPAPTQQRVVCTQAGIQTVCY